MLERGRIPRHCFFGRLPDEYGRQSAGHHPPGAAGRCRRLLFRRHHGAAAAGIPAAGAGFRCGHPDPRRGAGVRHLGHCLVYDLRQAASHPRAAEDTAAPKLEGKIPARPAPDPEKSRAVAAGASKAVRYHLRYFGSRLFPAADPKRPAVGSTDLPAGCWQCAG